MDGDEAIALAVGLIGSLWAAACWYQPLVTRYDPARQSGAAALVLTPPLCLLGLGAALQNGADPQVRGQATHLSLFLLDGGAWLGVTAAALPVVLAVRFGCDTDPFDPCARLGAPEVHPGLRDVETPTGSTRSVRPAW